MVSKSSDGFGSPKESTEWLSLISKGVSSGFNNRHERGILLRTQAALPFEAPKHVVWVIDFSKNIPSGKNRGDGRCGRVPVRRDPSPLHQNNMTPWLESYCFIDEEREIATKSVLFS
jgi:hypothetical protein